MTKLQILKEKMQITINRINNANSEYCKRDLEKHLKKLQREYRELVKLKGI